VVILKALRVPAVFKTKLSVQGPIQYRTLYGKFRRSAITTTLHGVPSVEGCERPSSTAHATGLGEGPSSGWTCVWCPCKIISRNPWRGRSLSQAWDRDPCNCTQFRVPFGHTKLGSIFRVSVRRKWSTKFNSSFVDHFRRR